MKDRSIKIALAGNPNSGKTTIFNSLTGMRQHVGNYPGVTVEKRSGNITYKGYNIEIIDLPGIYSLTAFSEEEIVSFCKGRIAGYKVPRYALFLNELPLAGVGKVQKFVLYEKGLEELKKRGIEI